MIWIEKIRSVLMKTEIIEFYSVVVSRAISFFDIVLSRYFMYEKNQYSISIVFLSFHVQVALDQYEAVRQCSRESQNRFQKLDRRRIKVKRSLMISCHLWSLVVILRFFFWFAHHIFDLLMYYFISYDLQVIFKDFVISYCLITLKKQ